MRYDFDEITERKGTNSLKYDFMAENGKAEDTLPLWVADMDFQAPLPVRKRLQEITEHGIFGYSGTKDDYFQALYQWYDTHFQWQIKKEWLVHTPGVVFALASAVRAFTDAGDAVLIQQPVYYPFSGVIKRNNRKLVISPLVLTDGHYEMDFKDMEKKIAENNVKLFLLCSPHNPVGRVWKTWELEKAGNICQKHGVIIVSDEIHSDFTFPGHTHHMIASLSEKFAEITVTCTAPSKTFNIAGLQVSNIMIPNVQLREKFVKAVEQTGFFDLNLMGMAACQAAYEEGEEWLEQLKEYLEGNLTLIRDFLAEKLPRIHLIEPEGTYLVWLDFRDLNMTEKEREELLGKKAKLWLDSGIMFGNSGEGFERINMACPRKVLKKALEQLEAAIYDSEESMGTVGSRIV
ncbi:MAG: pyridoxal phosphate-dependent aminotransferase [Eubacterium sp.]|nr:pyridoxal phosphate-dependent aminotransferase [Eubacterium sp.]